MLSEVIEAGSVVGVYLGLCWLLSKSVMFVLDKVLPR